MTFCLITNVFSLLIHGNGPHVLFSSGLYGIMPHEMYSNFLKPLKKNNSLILSQSFRPVIKEYVEEFCFKNNINELKYIAHSSFDHRILSMDICKQAYLIDPISLPTNIFNNRIVRTNIPVNIIKCKYSYLNWNEKPFILPGFETHFYGNNINVNVIESGHVDILNDEWSCIGSVLGIDSVTNFLDINENYNYESSLIKKNIRENVLDILN